MITLAEVARHAGVSAGTVSYVISGKRSVSPTTCERVERSIHELGCNAGARAPAGSKPHIIALMMPLRTDTYVPLVMEIAIAVTTTARTYGYDVLLLTGEEGPAAVRRVTGGGLADTMILRIRRADSLSRRKMSDSRVSNPSACRRRKGFTSDLSTSHRGSPVPADAQTPHLRSPPTTQPLDSVDAAPSA